MMYVQGPTGDVFIFAGDTVPDGHVLIPDPPILAKPQWDGAQWIEGATAQEITDAVEAHRSRLMRDVDEYAASRFFAALSVDGLSPQAIVYKTMEHLLKAMEANEVDNDRTADPEKRKPKKSKKDDVGAKTFPLVEAEAAERGITRDQLVDAILPLAEQQDGLFATLARYRPVYRDQLEQYVATGVYADDIAALDAIYAAYTAAVDTALGV